MSAYVQQKTCIGISRAALFIILKKKQSNKKIGTRSELIFVQRKPTFVQQTYERMLNITNHQGNANQNHNEIAPHISQNSCHTE